MLLHGSTLGQEVHISNCIVGLGRKSVACVLLLSLGRKEFPVDVNVARICARLGWIPLDSEEAIEVRENLTCKCLLCQVRGSGCAQPRCTDGESQASVGARSLTAKTAHKGNEGPGHRHHRSYSAAWVHHAYPARLLSMI